MNNITVYVGMDVHKESFTLADYTIETEKSIHNRLDNMIIFFLEKAEI